jgi:hypothetical protein
MSCLAYSRCGRKFTPLSWPQTKPQLKEASLLLPTGATSANGMVRPCSCAASDESGKGLQRQEHAMSQNLCSAIAAIGIDIGKNSFHVLG